jgi:hypothetical protein
MTTPPTSGAGPQWPGPAARPRRDTGPRLRLRQRAGVCVSARWILSVQDLSASSWTPPTRAFRSSHAPMPRSRPSQEVAHDRDQRQGLPGVAPPKELRVDQRRIHRRGKAVQRLDVPPATSHLPQRGAAFIPMHDPEILDIGSGTGFYLDRWRELGFPEELGSRRVEDGSRSTAGALPNIGHHVARHRGRIGRADPTPVRRRLDHRRPLPHHERPQLRADIREPGPAGEPGGILLLWENCRPPSWSQGGPAGQPFSYRHHLAAGARGVRAVGKASDVRVDELSGRLDQHAAQALLEDACPDDGCMPPARRGGRVMLYPLELLLVARLQEGPSTELMVCRRKSDQP